MASHIDYTALTSICKSSSKLSREVIDLFLLGYAAEREKLEPVIKKNRKKFKHILPEFEAAYLNMLDAQFIAHRIFSENGYIHKYLHHSAIKSLPTELHHYLSTLAERPWRFTVAEIISNPHEHFFKMADLNGEDYLLYSPGISAMLLDRTPQLWFTLIGFNGSCWETYGLIFPFISFNVDDLVYFGGEVNDAVYDEESLIAEIEKNPYPFFMLLPFCSVPVILSNNEEEIRYTVSMDDIHWQVPAKLRGFEIETYETIYRLTYTQYSGMPHYAVAYYDADAKVLVRYALTDFGFEMLTKGLSKELPNLAPVSDISLSFPMKDAVEEIFETVISFNAFELLFNAPEDRSEDMEALQLLIELASKKQQLGEKVDIRKLATEHGLDPDLAAQVWKVNLSFEEQAQRKFKA